MNGPEAIRDVARKLDGELSVIFSRYEYASRTLRKAAKENPGYIKIEYVDKSNYIFNVEGVATTMAKNIIQSLAVQYTAQLWRLLNGLFRYISPEILTYLTYMKPGYSIDQARIGIAPALRRFPYLPKRNFFDKPDEYMYLIREAIKESWVDFFGFEFNEMQKISWQNTYCKDFQNLPYTNYLPQYAVNPFHKTDYDKVQIDVQNLLVFLNGRLGSLQENKYLKMEILKPDYPRLREWEVFSFF